MTKFLVLYRADVSAQEQMAQATPEQAQAGMDAWMAWAGKAGDAIVDLGLPLTPTGAADATIAGYSILEAADAAAAQALLEGHPHLMMGTIDVHECLVMPGM